MGGGGELVFREWLIIKKEFCVSGLVCVTVLGLVFGRAYNEKDFSPRGGDALIHGVLNSEFYSIRYREAGKMGNSEIRTSLLPLQSVNSPFWVVPAFSLFLLL